MLDIFHNNAFGVVPLTDAINKPVFQPGRIGQMGLFLEIVRVNNRHRHRRARRRVDPCAAHPARWSRHHGR